MIQLVVEESEQGEIKNLGLEVQGKTILKIEKIILEKELEET